MEKKGALTSKSLWLGVLVMLAPHIPILGPWLYEQTDLANIIIGGLIMLARSITEKGVSFDPKLLFKKEND